MGQHEHGRLRDELAVAPGRAGPGPAAPPGDEPDLAVVDVCRLPGVRGGPHLEDPFWLPADRLLLPVHPLARPDSWLRSRGGRGPVGKYLHADAGARARTAGLDRLCVSSPVVLWPA